MVTDEEVLEFFRNELPLVAALPYRPVPVELGTILQEYADPEDLAQAIDRYSEKFSVDVSELHIDAYLPWAIPWFFRRWFTNKPVRQSKKMLTVRMFGSPQKLENGFMIEAHPPAVCKSYRVGSCIGRTQRKKSTLDWVLPQEGNL